MISAVEYKNRAGIDPSEWIRSYTIPKSERNMKLLRRLVLWLKSSWPISTRLFGIKRVLKRLKRYRNTFGWEKGEFFLNQSICLIDSSLFSDDLI